MGVYIPNMEMPNYCWQCPINNCDYREENMMSDDCPLIEISDEIWEALKPKVETMSFAKRGWITDDSNT